MFCWSIYVFLRRDVIYMISCKRFDGDNGINWRYDMFLNIIYACIKKGVMFNKLNMTLLLNNKFLGNRLWWKTSNEFKSFKNNMFEILSSRMLLGREIKDLIRCENNWFVFIMKFFVKILHEYDKKYNYNACDFVMSLRLAQ